MRIEKQRPWSAFYTINGAYMQVQRNAWWAQTIDRLLASGGTHFIGIGQMHTLGPDGISRQLRKVAR
jgi:uncharacterized protein YbaP (TraB family)